MCVERLQPLLASCSNALDWLRLSLAPQQRLAQDSCTAIVRNRRRAACGGRASIGAQRHICWAIAWAHHAATLRESAWDREDALSLLEPYSSYPSRASRGTLVRPVQGIKKKPKYARPWPTTPACDRAERT